jgi:hypothetical protein
VGGQLELARMRRKAAELNAFRVTLSDALRPLADPRAIQSEACRILGARWWPTHLDVPLIRDGQWVALLCVERDALQAWRADEIALIEETAERTWGMVELKAEVNTPRERLGEAPRYPLGCRGKADG